jgi:acyl-coenzyme A thioesterase PaaI-like protein
MSADCIELRNRIVQRLDELDEETLRELDMVLAYQDDYVLATAPEDEHLLTRRQLLTGVLAGGVVLSTTNMATALLAREQGITIGAEQGAEVGRERALVTASQTEHELQAELDVLRGLVAHYEQLAGIDIESAYLESLDRLASSIQALRALRPTLANGVTLVHDALERFESTIPTVREGMARADDILDALDQRLDNLGQTLSETAERAEPITDRLEGFFGAVVDRIPFGVGDRIQEVFERLRQLITAVPEAIVDLRDHLLEPLRSTWFAEAANNVNTGLLSPIRTEVLDPVEQMLRDLDQFAENWRPDVGEPMESVLGQRRATLESIAVYKRRNGLD